MRKTVSSAIIFMGTKTYQPDRDDYVPDGSEVKDVHPAQISREQLIPRIAARNKQAVKTIPTELFFYPKLKAGRRCSCFDIEVAPDSLCLACYGTGTSGGYTKYGTELVTLDITYENIRTANLLPTYESRLKPTPFALIEGATFGFLEATIPIKPNVGKVDIIKPIVNPREGRIDAFVKSPADASFVTFNTTTLQQRLFNSSLEIRIELRRPSVSAKSPRFSCLHIRYKRQSDLKIVANIPRTQKSNMLTDLGVTDDWQTQHFWMDNRLKTITTEDFLAETDGSTRWKIHLVNEFAPNNQLVSWDLDTRLIHPYEPYSKVPL